MRWIKQNTLSLAFLTMFALTLLGQALAGTAQFNDRQLVEGGEPVSTLTYVASSSFAVDVAENWQSEYLQFFLYIMLTVWLVQRGSPESKEPGRQGRENERTQRVGQYAGRDSPPWAAAGGLRLWVFGNSLGLVMGTVFVLCWAAQSVAGLASYNSERMSDLRGPVGWGSYVTSAEFWNRSLQNWQSELLAVLSMVTLSIYLRQRGSPESKPVGAGDSATGVQG